MIKIILAYSYLRFSRPEQVKGDSLRRQIQQTEELCKRHGWTLDSTLTDKGFSGWTGKNVKKGALGLFLAGIKAGKVKAGSVLVVEQIDRITRQEPMKALALLAEILEAGVNIATFRNDRVYTRDNAKETTVMMELVFNLCLAYDESAKKSERLKAAWQTKRSKATEKKLTGKVPGWLALNKEDGKFHLIQDKVKTVKRIVKMSIEGLGDGLIAKTLNQEEVPTLTGKGAWFGASINKCILRSRALIGEFQPSRMEKGKRVPDGEPIKGYYPPIIKEAEFYRMQESIQGRKHRRGRVGICCANLFLGLMKDVRNQGPIILRKLGGGANRRYFSFLSNSLAERGKGKDTSYRFPYKVWEDAFLRFTGDLLAADLNPPTDQDNELAERLEALTGRQADIADRLTYYRERLKTDKEFRSLLKTVQDLEEEEDKVKAELRQIEHQTQQPASVDLLDEAKHLQKRLASVEGEELLALRLKLRAVIRSLVETIYTRVVETNINNRTTRVLFAEVKFKSGATRTICSFHFHWGKVAPKFNLRYVPVKTLAETTDKELQRRAEVVWAMEN